MHRKKIITFAVSVDGVRDGGWLKATDYHRCKLPTHPDRRGGMTAPHLTPHLLYLTKKQINFMKITVK